VKQYVKKNLYMVLRPRLIMNSCHRGTEAQKKYNLCLPEKNSDMAFFYFSFAALQTLR